MLKRKNIKNLIYLFRDFLYICKLKFVFLLDRRYFFVFLIFRCELYFGIVYEFYFGVMDGGFGLDIVVYILKGIFSFFEFYFIFRLLI